MVEVFPLWSRPLLSFGCLHFLVGFVGFPHERRPRFQTFSLEKGWGRSCRTCVRGTHDVASQPRANYFFVSTPALLNGLPLWQGSSISVLHIVPYLGLKSEIIKANCQNTRSYPDVEDEDNARVQPIQCCRARARAAHNVVLHYFEISKRDRQQANTQRENIISVQCL